MNNEYAYARSRIVQIETEHTFVKDTNGLMNTRFVPYKSVFVFRYLTPSSCRINRTLMFHFHLSSPFFAVVMVTV